MDPFATIQKSQGLSNRSGQNNCFLNVLIQVLYHLEDFRVTFDSITWIASDAKNTFNALKGIFKQMGSSEGGVLGADMLRSAMASAYKLEGKFQLNEMDDVTEALEKLLAQIFADVNNMGGGRGRRTASATPLCFPYHIFSNTVVYHGVCKCGLATTPVVSTTNILNVSVDVMRASSSSQSGVNFGVVVKQAVFSDIPMTCKNTACGKAMQATSSLKQAPAVMALALNWSTANATPEAIKDLLKVVKTDFDLCDIFQNLDKLYNYSLVSMVCYYGQHYACFVRNVRTRMWVYYDDSLVKVVGTTWDSVLTKCESGRWQPQLLMYSRLGDSIQPLADSYPHAREEEFNFNTEFPEIKSPKGKRAERLYGTVEMPMLMSHFDNLALSPQPQVVSPPQTYIPIYDNAFARNQRSQTLFTPTLCLQSPEWTLFDVDSEATYDTSTLPWSPNNNVYERASPLKIHRRQEEQQVYEQTTSPVKHHSDLPQQHYQQYNHDDHQEQHHQHQQHQQQLQMQQYQQHQQLQQQQQRRQQQQHQFQQQLQQQQHHQQQQQQQSMYSTPDQHYHRTIDEEYQPPHYVRHHQQHGADSNRSLHKSTNPLRPHSSRGVKLEAASSPVSSPETKSTAVYCIASHVESPIQRERNSNEHPASQDYFLDKIDSFVKTAQTHKQHHNYILAHECYQCAADTLMDMIEVPEYWSSDGDDEAKRKAIATARRYLQIADVLAKTAEPSAS